MKLNDAIIELAYNLCGDTSTNKRLINDLSGALLEEADRRDAERIKVALTESRDKVRAATSEVEELRERIGAMQGDLDGRKRARDEAESLRDAAIRDRDVVLQQANDLRKDLTAADVRRRELEDDLRNTSIENDRRGRMSDGLAKDLAIALDTVKARDLAIAELQRQLAERQSTSSVMPELAVWREQHSDDVSGALRTLRYDVGLPAPTQRCHDAAADLLAALLKADPPPAPPIASVDIRERCARAADAVVERLDSYQGGRAAQLCAREIRALDVEDWSDGARAVLRLEVRVREPDQLLSHVAGAHLWCSSRIVRGEMTSDMSDKHGSWRFAVTLRQETEAPAPAGLASTDAPEPPAMSPKLKAAIDAWRTANEQRRTEIDEYLRIPFYVGDGSKERTSADVAAADLLKACLEES